MPTKTIQILNVQDALQAAGIQESKPYRLIGQIVHARFEWEADEGGKKVGEILEFYRQIRRITLTSNYIRLDVDEMKFDPTGALFFNFEEESWITPRHLKEWPSGHIKASLFEILPNPLVT